MVTYTPYMLLYEIKLILSIIFIGAILKYCGVFYYLLKILLEKLISKGAFLPVTIETCSISFQKGTLIINEIRIHAPPKHVDPRWLSDKVMDIDKVIIVFDIRILLIWLYKSNMKVIRIKRVEIKSIIFWIEGWENPVTGELFTNISLVGVPPGGSVLRHADSSDIDANSSTILSFDYWNSLYENISHFSQQVLQHGIIQQVYTTAKQSIQYTLKQKIAEIHESMSGLEPLPDDDTDVRLYGDKIEIRDTYLYLRNAMPVPLRHLEKKPPLYVPYFEILMHNNSDRIYNHINNDNKNDISKLNYQCTNSNRDDDKYSKSVWRSVESEDQIIINKIASSETATSFPSTNLSNTNNSPLSSSHSHMSSHVYTRTSTTLSSSCHGHYSKSNSSSSNYSHNNNNNHKNQSGAVNSYDKSQLYDRHSRCRSNSDSHLINTNNNNRITNKHTWHTVEPVPVIKTNSIYNNNHNTNTIPTNKNNSMKNRDRSKSPVKNSSSIDSMNNTSPTPTSAIDSSDNYILIDDIKNGIHSKIINYRFERSLIEAVLQDNAGRLLYDALLDWTDSSPVRPSRTSRSMNNSRVSSSSSSCSSSPLSYSPPTKTNMNYNKTNHKTTTTTTTNIMTTPPSLRHRTNHNNNNNHTQNNHTTSNNKRTATATTATATDCDIISSNSSSHICTPQKNTREKNISHSHSYINNSNHNNNNNNIDNNMLSPLRYFIPNNTSTVHDHPLNNTNPNPNNNNNNNPDPNHNNNSLSEYPLSRNEYNNDDSDDDDDAENDLFNDELIEINPIFFDPFLHLSPSTHYSNNNNSSHHTDKSPNKCN